MIHLASIKKNWSTGSGWLRENGCFKKVVIYWRRSLCNISVTLKHLMQDLPQSSYFSEKNANIQSLKILQFVGLKSEYIPNNIENNHKNHQGKTYLV